ncbi:class I lanthipeptide [Pedobacter steynii]|jgi:hypothetical protein|uniref:Uncharacterized protein n=1 Tax=Pedobacter steynii TaxID=430522 RepID=A0A1D7QN23_9SPHI|nr:class I lanthipeptide [Pedobacter steynii]AOM80057.1 hypothetical protein BFS30_24575 [Pedobacter steynii]
MKKKHLKLNPLDLQKETIARLTTEMITGGGPVTIIGSSCWNSCQPTCTLDGTKASQYVSNCCATG